MVVGTNRLIFMSCLLLAVEVEKEAETGGESHYAIQAESVILVLKDSKTIVWIMSS